jgi:hypothetical protein
MLRNETEKHEFKKEKKKANPNKPFKLELISKTLNQ